MSIITLGSENEPGPDQYHRQRSDPLLFRRAPAFSMGAKLDRGRLFGAPGKNTVDLKKNLFASSKTI